MLSKSSVSIANGLLDLDLCGGALIKACFVGLSNRFCTGTAYRRERNITNFIITSLKDCSFKEVGCEKLFVCQEKKAPVLRKFVLFLNMQNPNRTPLIVTLTNHSMAVKADGSLWAWGSGFSYELGNGSQADRNLPVNVPSGYDQQWQSVDTGGSYQGSYTMAIKTDGTLWAWGSGQLGDGTTTLSLLPKQITQDTDWKSVHAGGSFTIALKNNGTLWGWGNDDFGQLGIGDVGSSYQLIPVQIGSDENWKEVAVGRSHTIAIKEDGTLWTWGRNYGGQLGDGTTVDRNTPETDISFGVYYQSIAGGEQHTIAVKTDGSIWSWGDNGYGQLGDKTWNDKTTLVQIMTYVVTPSVSGNGTIDPATPQTLYCAPESIEFTLTPDIHNHIYTLGGTCDNSWYSDNGDGTYTLHYSDNETDNCTVIVNFAVTANFAIDTYSLTYTAGANGTLRGTSPQTVDYGLAGTEVTAVATANHHFVDWSDGSIVNPRTDSNISDDITVTANFAIDTYTLTYTAGANGALTGTSLQTVDYGSPGTEVTAVAAANHHFVDWSDGSPVNPRSDSNVTGDITVTANFAIDTYRLTYTAGANGTLTGTSPQTVDHGSSGTEVTAVAIAGFHFVDWSDGSTQNPRTDTNVTAIVDVIGNFSDKYTLSVVCAGNGAGTVTSTPPGIDDCTTDCSAEFTQGDSVTLIAVATEKKGEFLGWSGDGCAGTDDCIVTMDQAREITATFKGGFPWTMFLPAILEAGQP